MHSNTRNSGGKPGLNARCHHLIREHSASIQSLLRRLSWRQKPATHVAKHLPLGRRTPIKPTALIRHANANAVGAGSRKSGSTMPTTATTMASPTCGLRHDNFAHVNTQANYSRWHAHKWLTNNTDCACHGERVGGDFERTEGKRESNRLPYGPSSVHPRHTQNGRNPRVVCGK